MNLTQDFPQQEQLLQGVTMTRSISCPHQDFMVQNIIISQSDEIQSIHLNSHSFQYSSNQMQDVYGHKADNLSVNNNMKQTFKPKFQYPSNYNPNVLSSINKKPTTGKTLKTVLSLDTKLAQMHFKGIFEKSSSLTQQINQIILTQEYLKLKSYERQLLMIIKDVQFTCSEVQKQKKSLVGQISYLKMDNENLNQTVNRLYIFIDQIYTLFEEKQNAKLEQNLRNQHQITNVPFARTFYHSLDQLLQDNVEQDNKNYISFEQFESFVQNINRKIENVDNNELKQLKELDFFSKIQYKSRLTSLIDNLQKNIKNILEQTKSNYKFVQKNVIPDQSKMKIIEIFLNSISQNRQKLLKNIHNHQDKDLYFYYVVHSQMVTFLGILVNETKSLSLQISFGDHSNTWMKIFLDEIRQLKVKSRINLKQDHLRYFDRIEQLIKDVNELTIFRMMRNNL